MSATGLVIRMESNSASLRSTVPPWRVCKDNEDGTRPPVTAERFHDPKEAAAWITSNWKG